MKSKTVLEKFIWTLAIIGFLIGLVGIFDRLAYGHLHANYGSYVPWGIWVAGYTYLIGLSVGSFLVAAAIYGFNYHNFEKIGKLALITALVTVLGGLITVWLDLGKMSRVWKMMINTNFGSVMGWMFWFYSAYIILLLYTVYRVMRVDLIKSSKESGIKGYVCRLLSFKSTDISEDSIKRDKLIVKRLVYIGIPLAFVFFGAEGALFGSVGARPFWNSGLTPVTFIAGALLSGLALVTFLFAMGGYLKETNAPNENLYILRNFVLKFLAIFVLLEWADYSVILWSSVPSEAESLKLILFGHYWWVFWIIHLLLGLIIPLLLLIKKNVTSNSILIATGLIAFTFLSDKLNVVIPALATPELEGLRNAFTGPGLTYTYFPSLTEWLVLIWSFSFVALLFLLAKTYLPVIPEVKLNNGVQK